MMGLTSALLYNLHHPQGLASVLPGIRLKDELGELEKGRKEAPAPLHSLLKPHLDFHLQCGSWRYYHNSFGLRIIKHLNGNNVVLLLNI